MRRVVVTGMGVISPVGNDLESFWNNLTEGKNGVGMITRFDTTEQKVKVAAEVKDFEPTKYIEKSQVRKTDLFAQYALAAAVQAMEDAGLKSGENIDAERLGVYVGSGTGGINTITEQCNKFAQSGPKHISPFLVPMMIGNIASGSIAIRFDAQGPNLPVVTACAFKLALQEAGIEDLEKETIYINAHGTSTPLNDKSETLAIKLGLGEEAARKAYISSTKSMTGHMLGAAGAVEAIASVMTLKTGIIAPTIHYEQPDEDCDLNYVPNQAVKADVTLAISDSLGFGGHNGCIAFSKLKD